MKKILYIHHATGWGGAPLNLINIINSLDESAYKAKVLLIKDSIVSQKLQENNIEYDIAKSFFYKKIYEYYAHTCAGQIKWYQVYRQLKKTICWIFSRYYFAAKELQKFECDAVHLNSSVLTDWLSPASKKGKTIYHVQEPLTKGTFGLRYRFFRLQVKKYADQIIAISKDNAKRINIPEKTTVIYNYAEVPQSSPSASSYSSKKVLYIGGAAYIKGFYTLVEALDYLDEDITVYFGGNYKISNKKRNPLKQILKIVVGHGRKNRAAIQKIHKHPNAVVIGLTHKVDEYLDEVCCLVSPFSVPHFSRPVIEAHLHKKPAIGTDVKGMDEIIEHGKNGLIVPKDNAKALAEATNRMVSDGDRAKQLGEKGYRTAVRKFSPENIHKFQLLYDQL